MSEPATRSYVVVHETRYAYEAKVGLSRQILHLTPRPLPYQACRSHTLSIDPVPEILSETEDPFGNPITSLCLDADHEVLSVRAESRIDVTARPLPEFASSPPWEDVRARLEYRAGRRLAPGDLEATRYLFESTRVRNKRELAAWALESFPKGRPLAVGVDALMNRIHKEFAFDPKATIVSTPVMEVFAKKRGVCQDFAHLMLSCLRSIGLPARYVSGYLLTKPPPGKPRLVGADASHAWVSYYWPGARGVNDDGAWIDVDPTNRLYPRLEHVTLGWGRDYDDVTPMRGVLLGGGAHALEIEVTVVPEEEAAAVFGARDRG